MGMAGYHYIDDLNWIDALLNASMILTGMGPVDPMINNSAKVFASLYAIYSGVAFLIIFAVFFAPIFHHLLKKFRLMDDIYDESGD